MPGLLPAQLVEKYEKAAPQNAVGFVQFFGNTTGGAANTVTITDAVAIPANTDVIEVFLEA